MGAAGIKATPTSCPGDQARWVCGPTAAMGNSLPMSTPAQPASCLPRTPGIRVSGPGADVVAEPSPPQGLSVTQDDYSNREMTLSQVSSFTDQSNCDCPCAGLTQSSRPRQSAFQVTLHSVKHTVKLVVHVPLMFSNPVQEEMCSQEELCGPQTHPCFRDCAYYIALRLFCP